MICQKLGMGEAVIAIVSVAGKTLVEERRSIFLTVAAVLINKPVQVTADYIISHLDVGNGLTVSKDAVSNQPHSRDKIQKFLSFPSVVTVLVQTMRLQTHALVIVVTN